MASATECAQLSGRAYPRSQRNRTPIPAGWTEVLWTGNGSVSGFSAGVYRKGNEIVIAYTGTNEKGAADFVLANLPIGASLPSAQVIEAMRLYLDVKQQSPGAQITFTGHSLGGGLAGMMAVFFDRPATVFDPAPFELGARNPLTLLVYQAGIALLGYGDPAFDAYVSAVDLGMTFRDRESRVTGHTVDGEILYASRAGDVTILGPEILYNVGPQTILGGDDVLAGRISLHSITLLNALMLSPNFEQTMRALPEALAVLFNERLYARDPQRSTTPNFLDHLLRQHVGDAAAGLSGNAMIERLAADLGRIAVGGAASLSGVNRGLISAAAEHYYFSSGTSFSDAFVQSGSAVQFDVRRLPQLPEPSDGRGVHELARSLLSQISGAGLRAGQSILDEASRFTVQAGTQALNLDLTGAVNDVALGFDAADVIDGGAGNDLLIGRAGADQLTGGPGADVIDGGGDADTLDGGGGNETLIGGAGADVYRFSGAWGHDTIEDTLGEGSIWIDGRQLTSGNQLTANTWLSDAINGTRYGLTRTEIKDETGTVIRTDLIITQGSSRDRITIRDWQQGRLGITLSDTPAQFAASEFQSIAPTGTVPYGISGDLNGSATRDELIGNAGLNDLNGFLADDVLHGGDGGDSLVGGLGSDRLFGGAGTDVISGGGYLPGNVIALPSEPPTDISFVWLIDGPWWWAGLTTFDELWNGGILSGYTVETGGANDADAGDYIDAGDGDDGVEGNAGNDVIDLGAGDDWASGDQGSDTIIGGPGDDRLRGDAIDFGSYIYLPAEHGNDVITGDAGADRIEGDGGDDELYGGADNDLIWGDDTYALPASYHGNDYLDGGSGNDQLTGQGGNDELFGGTGTDVLVGDDTASRLAGEHHGADYLDGEDGDDQLQGQGGADTLFGGAGNDDLFGDDSTAVLAGQFHGADYLDGEDGADLLIGGGGKDTEFGGAGAFIGRVDFGRTPRSSGCMRVRRKRLQSTAMKRGAPPAREAP